MSGNVIPIHVRRQLIHLTEKLINRGLSEQTLQHDKLILITVAMTCFREIHAFDSSLNLLVDIEL